jgi:Ca-activated chloride channel family protein
MKKTFLLCLALFAFSTIQVFPQQGAAVNSEPTLNVSVMDVRAKPVAGLDKTAFTVTVDNQTAEIAAFFTEEPAEILFLLDKSKPMANFYRKSKGGDKSFMSELVRRFMQTSHPASRHGIFAFRETQEEVVPLTGDANRVLAAVDALDLLDMKGSASYVDACYSGIENLKQSGAKKRALVVLTRVGDSDSKYTSKQLIKSLRENNVMLYIIAVAESLSLAEMGTFIPDTNAPRGGTTYGTFIPSDQSRAFMAKFDELDKLTKITGGKSFYPMSAAEMADIFSRIGEDLRQQYTLGIKLPGAPPSSAASAKDRKPYRVKVKVKAPPRISNLIIRNREEIF